MKITKLHFNELKVFDDLELDFTDKDGNPLNQIVLAGLNGTGKSTVLEVVKGIINGAFESHYNYDSIRAKLYAELKHKDKDILWPTNIYKDKLSSILYNENIKVIYRPAKIRNQIIRKENRSNDNIDEARVIEISYEVGNKYSNPAFHVSFPGAEPVTNPEYIHYDKTGMKDIILKPIKNKVYENKEVPPIKIIENELIDMNSIFKDMDINSKFIDIDDDNLFFASANGQQITFEELSSGEKQLYFIGFMLKRMNINNTIIMIDEPEDSLHPKWQSQLLQFYSNIGENNQVILATHSPHIIGSAKAGSVFLLKNENGKITASHPKYSKGHSIPYVLSEIMDVDYRNTYTNNLVEEYLGLIRKGEHQNEKGKTIWEEIALLDPNSRERQRIDLSLRRFEAIGR